MNDLPDYPPLMTKRIRTFLLPSCQKGRISVKRTLSYREFFTFFLSHRCLLFHEDFRGHVAILSIRFVSSFSQLSLAFIFLLSLIYSIRLFLSIFYVLFPFLLFSFSDLNFFYYFYFLFLAVPNQGF